jgi:DUF1680 family protein
MIALLVVAASAACLKVIAVDYAPLSSHLQLRPPDPEAVCWQDGFWGERFDLCEETVLPSIWRVMQLPDNAATFQDIRMAAGLIPSGQPGGRKWSDGDCHKCIETMAHLYAVTKEDRLDRWMDEAIAWVAKAQEPDGYLSSWVQLSGTDRWENLNNHELYNMGHLMTAASVHHRVTGKDNYLQVAIRTGDYLYDIFSSRPKNLSHFGFNPSNIMGAVDLYRATRNPKYLELAGVFVDMRGAVPGGSNQNQASVPLRQEQEAVGHVVTATYLWSGAADVYAETGDQKLLNALKRLWLDVTTRKMYVTGGAAALHFGEVTRETFRRWPRDSVHEAFGAPFQLANRTAYNETCANIGNAMWNWRMLGLTGESKYADVMERILYNGMLSAMGTGGTHFFYTNPLRRCDAAVPLMSNDSAERWLDTTPSSPVNCYCCPPNVARTLAKLHGWAYSLTDDAVWVNVFGSSMLEAELRNGQSLRLTQETDYPWDDKVRITLQDAPNGLSGIMLRIPGWATDVSLLVNGRETDVDRKPGTFARLHRRWVAGDVIELKLPLDIAFLEANPLIEETRNQAAVMRGPIVYCLESTDLPTGVNIDDVVINPRGEWKPQWKPDLLGGVTVLEGQGVISTSQSWTEELYRRLDSGEERRIPITLIPYYAWANRGRSQMTVWLPISR